MWHVLTIGTIIAENIDCIFFFSSYLLLAMATILNIVILKTINAL